MTDIRMCEAIAEALSSGQPLSATHMAHVATCPSCRDLQDALTMIRAGGSAFPTVSAPALVSRIHQAVAAEPLPVSSTAVVPAGASAVSISVKAVVIAVLLLSLLGAAIMQIMPASSTAGSGSLEAPASRTTLITPGNIPASASLLLRSPVSGMASSTSASTRHEEPDE